MNLTVKSVPLTKNLSSFNIAMAFINSKLASNKLPMVNPITLRGVTEGVILTVLRAGRFMALYSCIFISNFLDISLTCNFGGYHENDRRDNF